MKCLAGMLAALLVAAAHAQTPSADVTAPDQVPATEPAASTANQVPAPPSGATQQQTAPADPIAPAQASQSQPPVQAASSQPPVPPADMAQATSYLKSATNDFTTCRRPSACNAYFESFGVAISFADGSISPYSHVQRSTATARECIKKAKAIQEEGNRSLAVQWAMAARVENRTVRDWLGNHPDAVLAALHQINAP